MSAVLKTVWFIETRFRDNTLSLEAMAEHAGVSRSHLSRIFPIATGMQLSSYLRGRRLTEAAKELANGAPDILHVALDAGYGSHEAFTRAFRDQFGLTPDEVRRRRSLATLDLVEPLRMNSSQKVALPAPAVDSRPALRIAGLGSYFTFRTMDEIPHLWQRFGPFLPEMRVDGPPPAFGVCGAMPEGSDGFDYFAAAPLPPGRELLPGLAEMTLPAGVYARFRHDGHISTIRSTCEAVYETGLPALGREPDTRWFSFVEYYGPDFEPSTGMGTVEIWVKLLA
ncbi:MAG TPA: AraC family transcriptional regulator [Devosia sp.]|nr:AraC family transcriptional regulator [Devosia sp.]